MENTTFAQESKVSPEKTEIELERRRTMEIIFSNILDNLKKSGEPNTFTFHGEKAFVRDGSDVDRFVAASEASHEAAVKVLESVRGGNGREAYYKEESAAKLEGLLYTHEQYAKAFAELVEQYPELSRKVHAVLPSLTPLEDKYLV